MSLWSLSFPTFGNSPLHHRKPWPWKRPRSGNSSQALVIGSSRRIWMLRDACGFSTRLISIQHKARAVAVRVCMKEAQEFRQKHGELQRLFSQSSQLIARHEWKDWYESGFYTHLHSRYEKLKENKLSPTRLYLRLSEGCEDNIKALSKLEASIYDHTIQHEILRQNKLSPVSRARTLLNRWCNGATPANAERLLRLSRLIGKFTQPCILAANIRTWRNGWVTVRRMRGCLTTRPDQCIFGCSPTAKDSIEHYVCCPTLQNFGK